MTTRDITCLHCGNTGEIEVYGQLPSDGPTKLFRHLGHNPFSGHLHYQCPACKIVLLVDPMSVLGAGAISTIGGRAARTMSGERSPCDSW